MEHPLTGNIDDLSLDQLQSKITELNKKLSIAHKMGNAQLRYQVSMLLEAYHNKFREKQQKQYDAATKNAPDFSNKIDIS